MIWKLKDSSVENGKGKHWNVEKLIVYLDTKAHVAMEHCAMIRNYAIQYNITFIYKWKKSSWCRYAVVRFC